MVSNSLTLIASVTNDLPTIYRVATVNPFAALLPIAAIVAAVYLIALTVYVANDYAVNTNLLRIEREEPITLRKSFIVEYNNGTNKTVNA